MPKISEKGRMMPASPIRKLVPYSDIAKSKGIKVYHLNIGQPDIKTPELALDAVKKFDSKVIEYSHSAGMANYRKRLSDYYRKFNIFLEPDEIIVSAGASEALLFTMQTIMDPGDEVIIPEPFYANYNGFAINSNIRVKPINSNIETGFALPPIEEFEKSITDRTKAILVCNPNNPTGYLYSESELNVLKELALKHDLYIIADEVYREFVYDGKKHHSVMYLNGIEQNTILIDSVSKRYSMCGARVGWLASKNKEVTTTALKFAQARLSPPTFGQVASEAAIDTPDSYFTEVLEEYHKRRNVVVESINKIEGAYCPNPAGAFYVVARLPIDDSDRYCQWLLEEFNDGGETVMLAPATGFYSTKGRGLNEVRISYVLNVADLKNAMRCIESSLKVYPGRKI